MIIAIHSNKHLSNTKYKAYIYILHHTNSNANTMWVTVSECIRRSAKDILGISRGGARGIEGAWWWNEEVKEKVKGKQDAYIALIDSRTDEEFEVKRVEYKAAKKIAKKVVTVAKHNMFDRLYQRLETKEGEKDVFRLARAWERRTRDLGSVRCIKDDDGKILVEEPKIRERWQSYFSKLFNDKRNVDSLDVGRRNQEG